jgi:quercetin dioxygenase-like cupin family protein
MQLRVTPWNSPTAPTKAAIRKLLDDEGLTYYAWSSAPLEVFSAHTHMFNKIIYVLSGSITFSLPVEGGKWILEAGDRLELPVGTLHSALVSVEGVECYEAHC